MALFFLSINESEALKRMRADGLLIDSIIWDGNLHRVPVEGKAQRKDGAYIAHDDRPASVWWQNWRTGETGTWSAGVSENLTPAEKRALNKRIEEDKRKREAEQALRYDKGAEEAAKLYQGATDCTGHPYLTAKGVKSVLGLRVSGDGKTLLVPMYNKENKLRSLQKIWKSKDKDGKDTFPKTNFENGDPKGHFFPIGNKDSDAPLLIGEGLSTCLSLHECTGYPVLVTFGADNLMQVAKTAQKLYPARQIILCADNDIKEGNSSNVGVEKATKAAMDIKGLLAIPHAKDGKKVDWNDLHQAEGKEEVQKQMRNLTQPAQAIEQVNGDSSEFINRDDGLYHIASGKKGKLEETRLGPPLHILGSTRDENSASWGLLLQWRDPDSELHKWAMPISLLVGNDLSAWLGRLANEGWIGASSPNTKKLLAQYLATANPSGRILCVPRTGWHQGVFVLPDETIGTSKEKIVLQVQSQHNPVETRGTLEAWQQTIGAWARGNSRLTLVICAALAAGLLESSGQESGGFNLVGGSSTGKTTALVAAASVWGKGSASGGYVQNWRATANGLEGLAAFHSDALLCLDEISQAPAKAIGEASYMLANGMGKTRATKDGSAKAVKSWRCLVLSTGEKGLTDKIKEEDGTAQAGQMVRLIDIPADAEQDTGLFECLHGHTSAQAFATKIKEESSTNYGHLARAFLREFLAEYEKNVADVQDFVKNTTLLCPVEADGQVKRVTQRFLVCAIAGEMATKWGLLPWKEGDALASIKKCFSAWLFQRGGTDAAEDMAIKRHVMLIIEKHGTNCFQDIINQDISCSNRMGFRRFLLEGGTEYFILPESFRAEFCKGFDPKRVISVLEREGLLIPGDGNHKTRPSSVPLPGFGRRKRCYMLRITSEESQPD